LRGAGEKTKFDSSDDNSNENDVSSGVEDLDSELSALNLLDKTKT
jgi:hypothetical protein